MVIIAKPQTEQVLNSDRFELFQATKGLDLEGNDIDILQSIGTYAIADLEGQKQSYLNDIEKIDEKIMAINSI